MGHNHSILPPESQSDWWGCILTPKFSTKHEPESLRRVGRWWTILEAEKDEPATQGSEVAEEMLIRKFELGSP